MTLTIERFNNGAAVNGANLQQTVNTSHTIVNPNNATTFKFTNSEANPFTGQLCAQSTAGSGVQAEMRHDKTASTRAAQAVDFKVSASPPTGSSLDFLQTRGTVQNAGVRMHTDGSLRVLNLGSEIGGGATLVGFISTYAGIKVRVDQEVIEGTTSANGRILTRLRALSDLSTVLWSYDSGTTRNAGVIGTDTITSFRAGKITAAAVIGNMVFYGHDAQDSSAGYVADPTFGSPDPSGTVVRELVHRYDFNTWSNTTTVVPVITSGPALTIEVDGLVVSVIDDESRIVPVDIQFTIDGPGSPVVRTDTIPVGGTTASQVIERVVATAVTPAAGDWA